ncbi:MAG: efflux RND transporter periplasmic adaptor subunit [Verrucomicrobiales bacterium]|nr:efflux RND transporter periplasmic adaptor subunit [Verrucomicrobiales bacterium]
MALDQNSLNRLRIDRKAMPPERRWGWWWVVLVILVVLVGSAGLWLVGRGAGARVPEVTVATVREVSGSAGVPTLLNASGYVTARRQATVSAKVTGKVIEVLVEEGTKVEADQVVARLDSSNVVANQRLAEAQLEAARSLVKETQAQLAEAETNLVRYRRLLQERIGTQEAFDKAEVAATSLRARLEKQTLDILVAERSLGLWLQQLEDLVIRAPFAGVVTVKNAQPGEVVSPMSSGGFTRTGICTLVDMDSLEIEVDVNESYINRVSAGQSVEATLDAYTDLKLPCKVIAIIPTADRQKATVKVRVGFDRLDPRILPQMGVKVAFRGPEDSSAATPTASKLIIPKGAVREVGGRQVVWIVKDALLERRAITAEAFSGSELRVVAGLSVGERLVVDPPGDLVDGAKIREKKS